MIIQIPQPFDLHSTLNSGQSFRWEKQGEWVFGVIFSNIVKIREVNQGIELFRHLMMKIHSFHY